MITFLAHLRVRQDGAAAFEELMDHVCRNVREHEPGVAYYGFARGTEEPGIYVVVEVYRDREAHAAHMASRWVQESLPKAARLLESEPDIKQYVSPGTEPIGRRLEGAKMSDAAGMSDSEHLLALHEIYRLKALRDHAVDRKDWATYAALHTDDYVAASIRDTPIIGGEAAAAALSVQLANVTTVHHSHSPVIDFQDRDHATGRWAMEDNLFWKRNGEKQWLRGFGFYHESYRRCVDGEWRFTHRRLERTHAETSPGAAALAADVSGENTLMG